MTRVKQGLEIILYESIPHDYSCYGAEKCYQLSSKALLEKVISVLL